MNVSKWWRAAGAAVIVTLLAAGCGEESPLEPDSIGSTTAAITEDAADEATDPLFLVTPPGADQLDDPADPADPGLYNTNLWVAGGSHQISNSLGDAFFLQFDEDESSGTGVFNPFVRISANTLLQQGVNSSGRNLVWDENSAPGFTRDLKLDEVPTIECPAGFSGFAGQTCREFALDINEVGSGPLWYLSLDATRIYISEQAKICDISVCKNGTNNPFDFDKFSTDFGVDGAQLVWAMDGLKEENHGIGLNFQLDNGSGRADMVMYVPESDFPAEASAACPYDQGLGDDCPYFVHFYSHFGADDSQDDGFEEWDVRVLPIVLVEKTANVVADKRWNWTVDKTPDADYAYFVGDSIIHEYDIDVDKVDYDLENFRVNGTITITNPDKKNPAAITKITDVFGTTDITSSLVCPFTISADGTVDPPALLPKNSSVQCTYGPISIGDDFTTETNTATVRLESGGQFEGSADADVADVTIDDEIDESVNLTDSENSSIDIDYSDDGSTSYQAGFACDDNVTNIATIVGNDSGNTLGTDDATVTVTCYDLSVAKTPDLSFERKYFWDITKSADQDTIGPLASGQTFTANYSVQVDTTGSTDSKWADSGTITITNNHPTLAADLTGVVDTVFNGTSIVATVSNCSATSVAADGGTVTCDYDATLPDATTRTNKAFATMQNRRYYFDATTPVNIGTTTYEGQASIDFTSLPPTSVVDECIDVSDTFPEFAAQNADTEVCVGVETLPVTFTYTKDFVAANFPDCTETDVPNTASFITNDTDTTDSDSWTITVIRECPSCNLTQGYWKTHNDLFWGGAPEDDTWYDLLPGEGASATFFLSGGTWFDAMWTAPAGNAYWQLSRQWIAATLNVEAGSDGSGVASELAWGQALFETFTPAEIATWDNSTGGVVPGFGPATRHDVIMWAAALDGFNNQDHCDDDLLYTVQDDVPIQ
jgi:hypothetical protein